MKSSIKIAVVIVNWNSGEYLVECLRSLKCQTVQPDRVLIVDNASTDASLQGLEQEFEEWDFIKLETNTGFSAGNNFAVKKVEDCDWIAFLNPDAMPHPDWLARLKEAIDRFPEVVWFGSHMQGYKNDRMDGTGDVYHVCGAAWRRDHGLKQSKIKREAEEIFSPCAAAALIRRDVFLQEKGFDENFFCYNEDVDLGFRLRLKGYRCFYIPDAVVEHVGSASTDRYSDFAVYHSQRNLIWSYFRNMPDPWFWIYLPQHILFNLVAVIWFSLKGKAGPIFKAKWDALKGLPRVWKLRRGTQNTKTGSKVVDAMSKGFWVPYSKKKRSR